ncbi:MAG TPA: hypothetical protein VHP32_06850 [Ignavibacteria bacterium]|nr:hypothetical protein [Ignavibacteria bacterium]
MFELFIGSLTLSIIHALIPSHWLPFIAIGKTENWRKAETLQVTAISGFAHVLSTVLIGIIIGIIGYEISSIAETITHLLAPLVLFIAGIIYIILYIKHAHTHRHLEEDLNEIKSKSKKAIILTLITAMFFSPCIELEAYYFNAGLYGWQGILLVSVVYLFITISGMVILVYVGQAGVNRLNQKLKFLDRRENLITGIAFIVLALFVYFVEI